jgi:hypothetical protein
LLLLRLVIGVTDVNEQFDTGRDRRRANSNKNNLFLFSSSFHLLADDKCDGDEQALPARDCFNDDTLADNCR